MASQAETDDDSGFGAPSEYLPTLFVLIAFAVVLGLGVWGDGTPFLALVAMSGMALGLGSGASARMILGRNRGSFGAAVGLGVGVALLMVGFSVLGAAVRAGGFALGAEGARLMALQTGLASLGAVLGALALHHLRAVAPAGPDEDLPDDAPADDVDYSTQPEELVCLLTNQVVNPQLDGYVVCHNRFNDGQVCHAVYLKTYVHLLQGQCKRCYQKLRERDLGGFNRN